MQAIPTLRLLSLAGLALGFDLATKAQARAQLPLGELVTALPDYVWFALAVNSYGAMGLGAAWPPAVVQGALLALSVLCFGGLVRSRHHPAMQTPSARVGVALLVGALLGNQGERIFRSDGVTDFLVVGLGSPWPASFNLADVWALGGGALVLASLVGYGVKHPHQLLTPSHSSTASG